MPSTSGHTTPGEDVGAALVAELVDDAGLFPPTALPMPDAVARHREDVARGDKMHTNRFLCPVSRLDELREQLTAQDRFDLGVIADTGPEALAAALADAAVEARFVPCHVEAPIAVVNQDDPAEAVAALLSETPTGLPLYVEPARWEQAGELTATVVRARLRRDVRLKLRCGGVRAELFPTPEELAAALAGASAARVPFKATAGLHEAVRHTDGATGFTHHGYVNLLAATASCLSGAAHGDSGSGNEPAEVAAVLDDRDPASLVRRLAALDIADAVAVRRVFTSYGSCDTRKPLTDARDLGLRTEDGNET